MRTGTSPMKAFIGRPPSDEGDAAAGDFSSLADDWVGLTIHRTVHSEMNGPLTVLFCRKSVRRGHSSDGALHQEWKSDRVTFSI